MNANDYNKQKSTVFERGRPRILVTAAMLATGILGSGCERANTDIPSQASAVTQKLPTMTTEERAATAARYRCDGGQRVDVHNQTARIALSDGRVVKVDRIENSAPTTFEDNGLAFVVYTPQKAELNDEYNRSIACRIEVAGAKGTAFSG